MHISSCWLRRIFAGSDALLAVKANETALTLERKDKKQLIVNFSQLDDDLAITRGPIFSSLAISSPVFRGRLHCISRAHIERAELLCAAVHTFRVREYSAAHATLKKTLESLLKKPMVVSNFFYLRRSFIDSWKTSVGHALKEFEALNSGLIESDFREAAESLRGLARNIGQEGAKLNSIFIEKQLEKYKELFDSVEKNPLTESQRKAVIVDADSTLVLAGAGSGKTSVLISKIAYLLASGKAVPDEILVVAFNTKASSEIDQRIKACVPNAAGIKTQTFHAFGRSIVGRYRGTMPDISPSAENDLIFSQLVENLFRGKTESDQVYANTVLRYFVEYLYERVSPLDIDRGEYAEKLTNTGLKTAKGEYVKSTEERIIADFLFVNRVDYRYEQRYEFETASETYRQYRPDFYLTESGLYLEHFALSRAGHPPPKWSEEERRRYLEGITWKRELHRRMGTKLLETFSYQQSDGVLTDILATTLQANGVALAPMTLWEFESAVAELNQDYPTITRMAELIGKCLRLHKSGAKTSEDLRNIASRFHDKNRAQAFLDVYFPVFEAYAKHLSTSGEIDFDDMIVEACDALKSGAVKCEYKYVLVDEFQDLAGSRKDLIDAVLGCRKGSALYCVGDDWQSIYSFAGSDVSLTTEFSNRFPGAEIANIGETFRYGQRLLTASSNFVQRNPAQLKKAVRAVAGTERHLPIKVVLYSATSLEALEFVSQDVAKRFDDCTSMYLLGRYSHTASREGTTLMRELLPINVSVENLTVHKSKGMEADIVIVNEVNTAFRLGFPSKIRDDSLLQLFRPPSELYEDAEERRLFYVAMTRARKCVYITARASDISPFLHEMLADPLAAKHIEVVNVDGSEASIEAPCVCPACRRGTLTLKSSAAGISYFRCSLGPFCDGIYRACKYCSRSPMLPQNGRLRCQNASCGKALTICPSCGDGYLVKRKGPYGEFLGCSNFSRATCKHTVRSLEDARRKGVSYFG